MTGGEDYGWMDVSLVVFDRIANSITSPTRSEQDSTKSPYRHDNSVAKSLFGHDNYVAHGSDEGPSRRDEYATNGSGEGPYGRKNITGGSTQEKASQSELSDQSETARPENASPSGLGDQAETTRPVAIMWQKKVMGDVRPSERNFVDFRKFNNPFQPPQVPVNDPWISFPM